MILNIMPKGKQYKYCIFTLLAPFLYFADRRIL
jgi:hypothetical protein